MRMHLVAPSRVRWRLSLWYALSLTLIFTLCSVCVFEFVRMGCMGPIREQMEKDIALVQGAYARSPDDMARLEADGIVSHFLVAQDDASPAMRSAYSGTAPIFAARAWSAAQFPLEEINTAGLKGCWMQAANGKHYFVQQATVPLAGKTLRINVAQEGEQAYTSVKKLALALVVGIPFVLLASLGGGYLFAGQVLSPIGAMARKAREITADKLSDRLPVQDPVDEFGHLAGAFNDTLTRLEDAFERLRRFTADASHELRTPLAVIQSVGEAALQQAHDAAHYENVIGSILEETDRLARLLDGLLLLTRAEAGQLPLRPERIALADFALDVANCLRVLAEEKQQTLRCDGASSIHATADRATLKQALLNLVANAIRYTPEHGSITVHVGSTHAGAPMIEVHDTGMGIAPEHHDKIFERFYRVDKDRSRETGGAGLGLAIARWAVELNGGSLTVESEPSRGSVFRITL